VSSGCYPTAGNFYIEIEGESFGKLGADVTLGPYECSPIDQFADPLNAQTHNRIVCEVPQGYGDKLPVVVTVNGRSSNEPVAVELARARLGELVDARIEQMEADAEQRKQAEDDARDALSAPRNQRRLKAGSLQDSLWIGEASAVAPSMFHGLGVKPSAQLALARSMHGVAQSQEVGGMSASSGRALQTISPGMPLTMEEAYDAAYTFAFDPPFVEAIVSNTPDARGADLQIRGLNFGWQQNDVLVTIGGMECMNAQWQNDGLIRCSKLEDVVGPKNLTVLAANRTEPFVFEAWEELVISEC